MKIRILSDLHLDINKNHPFSLIDTETFTILCGDISGNPQQTIEWINNNIKQGVFVEGNHIGYDSQHSIQYIENLLASRYPTTAPIAYLKNSYKIVDDIVFVGGILWTDFRLYGNAVQPLAEFYALQLMNDFRYNYTNTNHIKDETENNFEKLVAKEWIRKLRPGDTEKMFASTLKCIDTVCRKFPNKKIVVVTHHAPSSKSIPEIYLTDKSTPAFASNLEQFILDHPNIKLWCHGHIHSACDYPIGNCRVICNPRGYVQLGEQSCYQNDFVINF